jgi:tetratricopeptide (TPR) repeat protein
MKSYLFGLLILPFFFSHAQQAKFQAAENAYASGLYKNAIDLYEQLIAEPFNHPELYFNLGNAAYKKEDLVLAIKSYRRAQYLAPTDPDIRANLRYALEATGAPIPEVSRFARLFFSLSENQWIKLSIGLYALLIITLFILIVLNRRRVTLNRFAGLLAFCLVISLTALTQYQKRNDHPEYVVIKSNAAAKLAPLENSKTAFSLPAGTLITVLRKHHSEWVQIRINNQTGWVKTYQIDPI